MSIIPKEKIIEKLKEIGDWLFYEYYGCASEEQEILHSAAKLLECNCETWTKITDGLPPVETPVLITYIGSDGVPRGDGTAAIIGDSWYWWEGAICESLEPVDVEITHWQYLPALPEEYHDD